MSKQVTQWVDEDVRAEDRFEVSVGSSEPRREYLSSPPPVRWTRELLVSEERRFGKLGEDAFLLAQRLRQLHDDKPFRTAFTGLGRREGVSTIVLDTARAMARISQGSVLLIDADLRHPGLSRRLGVAKAMGIADVVHHTSTLEESLKEIVPGSLFFLPAGVARDNCASTLAAATAGEVFRAVGNCFETVIVDTAPMGEYVDGAFVAGHMDGMVLVVGKGKHRRTEMREIRKELTAIGVGKVGMCLSETRKGPVARRKQIRRVVPQERITFSQS